MAGFNLVAQLQIQAPNNLGRVASQIRGQLKNISATVDVKINPTSISGLTTLNQQVVLLNTNLRQLSGNAAAASTALSNLGRGFSSSSSASSTAAKNLSSLSSATAGYTKTTAEAANATEEFGRAAGLAGRRFLGFSLVAGSVVGAISAIKSGITEALKFEREFIKLSQIGGATKTELASLNNEITRLSTSLGVSSKDLVATSVTLRQAGLSVKEVTSAMEVLAKTTLAPTFDNIADTTEGAIAIMAQFKIEAKDLEKALASANAVAAAFAVESKDIITAVQRAGGAFKSVGGDLDEFIALFTSVRQTTRESAESIATGLRTIFTRLQRKDTVDALKDLGINLRFTRQEAIALGQVDLENQFVGAFEGVRRLSDGLNKLRTTDPRYSEVVEQLGGYRQISKVIPLIQQFAVSQKALNVAQGGFASITTSAEEAQSAFLVKLQKVKEEFLSLARTIANSNAFQGFLDTSLKLAKAFIGISEALSPVIPLLTALTTFRLASNVSSFFSGVTQGFSGVGPKRLAKGGVVPGSGHGDTVPAMLTPGEFVINKGAAQSIGYGNLARANKYATGGLVSGDDSSFKVGNYALNRNQVRFLYAIGGAKDGGKELIGRNQDALAKIFGPAKGGKYENANQLFEKIGFATNSRTGVVQSLSEFRNTINESKAFVGERNQAIASKRFVKNGKLLIPFGGESIGFVASGITGGESGKQGRDTLNAGIRLETLSADNIGGKANRTVGALLKNAGVKEVQGGVNVRILGLEPTSDFSSEVIDSVQSSIQKIYADKFGAGRVAPLNRSQTNTISGYLFEKYVEGLSGKFTAGNESDFEYVKKNPGSTLGKAFDKFVFPSPVTDTYLDLKARYNRNQIGDVMKKYLNVKSRDGGLAENLGVGLGGASPAEKKKSEPPLKFATGGIVPGSGHGDTVPANLTPGEFVIKKSSAQAIGYQKLSKLNRYANGGAVNKKAFVLDFDDTLAIHSPEDTAKIEELKNSKQHAAAFQLGFNDEGTVLRSQPTPIVNAAINKQKNGYDVYVLTARSSGTNLAISKFAQNQGLNLKDVIGVADYDAVKDLTEPGKKAGTTKKASVATKKAFVLNQLKALYEEIHFLDDNVENVLAAANVPGVKASTVKPVAAKRKALGGMIQYLALGGEVDLTLPKSQGIAQFYSEDGRTPAIGKASAKSVPNDITQGTVKGLARAYEAHAKKVKLPTAGNPKRTLHDVIFGPNPGLSAAAKAAIIDPSAIPNNSSGFPFGKLGLSANVSEFNLDKSGASRKSGALNTVLNDSLTALDDAVINGTNAYLGQIGAKRRSSSKVSADPNAKSSISGFILEGFLEGVTSQARGTGTASFDFENTGSRVGSFKQIATGSALDSGYTINNIDAKLSKVPPSKILAKALDAKLHENKIRSTTDKIAKAILDNQSGTTTKFAAGGSARGQDTVPAMLTPGEFVINKKAANRIGLGNLNRMNQTGKVQYFASGGVVSSPTQINNDLSSGATVTLSVGEIDKYRTELSATLDALKIGISGAVKAGDSAKVRELGQSLLKAGKELETLDKIIVQTADDTAKAGLSFNAVQDISLKRRATGGLERTGATVLTGETVEQAQARFQEEAQRQVRARRVEARQQSGAFQDAANNTPYLRNLAARRVNESVVNNFNASRNDNQKNLDASLASGTISQQTYNAESAKDQAKRAKARASLNEAISSQEEKVKQELIAAETKRIKVLNLGISKQEIANIAQENVAKALSLQSRIIIDTNNKAVGLAATMNTTSAALKVTEAQAKKLADAEAKAVVAASAGGAASGGGFFSKVGSRLQGAGLLGLTLGTSYGSQFFENKPQDFELAARSGNTSEVTGKAGIGGALTGAATGAAIGSIFGPFGAVIGAAGGAVVGFRDAIKQAEKDIRDAKISNALNDLSTIIEGINKSGQSATALQKSKIATQIGLVDENIKAGAADESTQFFKAGFGFVKDKLGFKTDSSDSRFDTRKFLDITDKERRSTIGKELPNIFELLNNESAKLGENFAKASIGVDNFDGDKAKKDLETLDKSFIESNRELLKVIADLKKTSVEDVAKDFRRGRIEGFGRARISELRNQSTVNIGEQLGSFLRLEQVVAKVSSSMEKLQVTSINLNDIFEGTISNTLSTRNNNLGSLDRNDLDTELKSLTAGLGGGSAATSLGDFTGKFLSVKDTLSSVLPGVLSSPQLEGEDIGTKIRNELERVLGKGAGNDPALRAIIGSVQSSANNEGIEGLKLSSKSNLSSVVDKLTAEANPLSSGEEIRKKLDEAGNKFVNELIKYQSRIQRVGEQEDKLRQLQVARLRNTVDQQAAAAGERTGGLDRIKFEDLQAPIVARAQRLTGLGGQAENVGAITAKLNQLNEAIGKATLEQQKGFDTDKFASDATRAAAENLSNLKRQSVDLQTALKELTDVSTRNAAAQEKLSKIQEDRSSRLSFGERFLRGDRSERAEINRGLALTNNAALSGNLDGLRPEQIRSVLDTLSSFGNAKVNFGGKQLRANDLREDLIRKSAGGVFDVSPESKKEEDKLNKVIADNFKAAEEAQKALIGLQKDNNVQFLADLKALQVDFFAKLAIGAANEQLKREEQTKAKAVLEKGDVTGDLGKLASLRGSLGGNVNQNQIDFLQKNIKDVETLFTKSGEFKRFENALKGINTDDLSYNVIKRSTSRPFGGPKITTEADIPQFKQQIAQYLQGKTAGLGITNEEIAAGVEKISKRVFENGGNRPSGTDTFKKGSSVAGEIEDVLKALFQGRKDLVGREKAVAFNRLKEGLGPDGSNVLANLDNLSFNKNFADFNAQLSTFTGDKTIDKLTKKLEELTKAIADAEKRIADLKAGGAGVPVPGKATGGKIGSSASGNIFKAKGSDTVPAMLTPGEFVINATAAKANKELLEKINNANGKKVNYLARGGPVAPEAFSLPKPDEDFGKYLSSIDDGAFDYLYNIGSPQVLSYYNNLRKNISVKKGVGSNVTNRIREILDNLNPANKNDKIKFLQYLPEGQKKNLLATANRAKSDFDKFDKMDPKELLKFYSGTVYPFVFKKVFDTEGKIKNANIEINKQKQAKEPNEKYLTKLQGDLASLNDYYSKLPSLVTPDIAKTYDLTPGSEKRALLLKIIKGGYLNAVKTPDIAAQAKNLGLLSKGGKAGDGLLQAENNIAAQERVLEAKGLKDKKIEDRKKEVNDKKLELQREASFNDAVRKLADYRGEDLQLNELKLRGASDKEVEDAKKNSPKLIALKKASDDATKKAKGLSNLNEVDFNNLLNNKAASTVSGGFVDAQVQLLKDLKNVKLTVDDTEETFEEKVKNIFSQDEKVKAAKKARDGAAAFEFDETIRNPNEAIDKIINFNKLRSEYATKNFKKFEANVSGINAEEFLIRKRVLAAGDKGQFAKYANGELLTVGDETQIDGSFNLWKSSLAEYATSLFSPASNNDTQRLDEKDNYAKLLDLINFKTDKPRTRKFATGGLVPGSGYGDTVPAMLSPGEFVLNSRAVEKVGLSSLHHMNNEGKTAKMATGGPVRAGGSGGNGVNFGASGAADFSQAVARFESSMSILKTAFDSFNSSASALTAAMTKFPSAISGSFTHSVNVNIQGGEALAALSPEIEKIVVRKSKEVLANYVKNTLPEAGIVG